ncbi:MAG: hypothetical protein F4X94_03795 [Dehalococcoidia bacterium]|nr:hypothetical protein [Dehalococcoidia bacterium]
MILKWIDKICIWFLIGYLVFIATIILLGFYVLELTLELAMLSFGVTILLAVIAYYQQEGHMKRQDEKLNKILERLGPDEDHD